uniref:Uncharacterized protein n=1 Tax=Anguilla anguilla TaxID=7936 RepID=A0A0E9RS02_ANGAN
MHSCPVLWTAVHHIYIVSIPCPFQIYLSYCQCKTATYFLRLTLSRVIVFRLPMGIYMACRSYW